MIHRAQDAVRIMRPAYAKINLYLDVLSCRADGYHELLTVMQSISLHDDIILYYEPWRQGEIRLRIYGAPLPTDGRNLVYRAAGKYMEATGQSARVSVTLRKKIPIAAGLAGGSSDAAATLLALWEASGHALSRTQLMELAAELGSDVPFCLAGGTQICRGRGEILEPLPLAAPLYAVVAIGREHVSTPEAFRRMDQYYHGFDGSVMHGGAPDVLIDALRQGHPASAAETVYNAFEPVILPTFPQARSLRDRLLEAGAYTAHMSGSGPSVFGLFDGESAARRAAALLGRGAYAVRTVGENFP